MNKVFAIRNDAYKFPELDLEVDDIIESMPASLEEDTVLDFSINNYAMLSWWPMPDTEFRGIGDESFTEVPDLSKWIDSTLVLSPKAHRILGELLKEYGELLPITVKSERFYIFNCLTFGRVKEEFCEKSYYEGSEIGIKKIVFDDADIQEKLVFKTRYNACFEMYCGEKPKEIIESFKLTGVSFSDSLVQDLN